MFRRPTRHLARDGGRTTVASTMASESRNAPDTSVEFLCPLCHKKSTLERSQLKQRIDCPACRQRVVVIVPGESLLPEPELRENTEAFTLEPLSTASHKSVAPRTLSEPRVVMGLLAIFSFVPGILREIGVRLGWFEQVHGVTFASYAATYVCASCFLVGVSLIVVFLYYELTGIKVNGKVVELVPEGDCYRATVEYAVDGNAYLASEPFASNPPAHKVGQTVPVYCPPKRPQAGQVISEKSYLPLAVLLVIGIVSGLAAFILGVAAS
jgi:DNA-directed RNA polymerase subunit RPC12/RpoP